MAIEAKRGCGYRKVGGLYLVSDKIDSFYCDRLPFVLNTCPCCGGGIKQAMGWTWVDIPKLFGGNHLLSSKTSPNKPPVPCICALKGCPLCSNIETIGKAGLLWIGAKFYKYPFDFEKEAIKMGISKRIKGVPHGFELGKTWVMLAHPQAYSQIVTKVDAVSGEEISSVEFKPGIIKAWLPTRLERLYKESDKDSAKVKKDVKHGITPIFVPDNDKDHQGSVYDKKEKEEPEFTFDLSKIEKKTVANVMAGK